MVKEMLQNGPSIVQAVAHIKSLEQQMMSGGSVDSESHQLNNLIIKLNLGQISPEDAMVQANNLANRRQDYH